jgi:ATP-binding cassette subfamily B protein
MAPTVATTNMELWRKAIPYLAPFRAALVLVFVLAGATAAIAAAEPLVLKLLFDTLASQPELTRLGWIVALLLGVLLAHTAAEAVLDWYAWRTRIALDYRLLAATVDRLHALPLSFHRRQTVGALMAKVERGINGTVTAFSGIAQQLLPSIVYLVVSVVVMMRMDWRLALVVVAFAPWPVVIGARAAQEQVERERTLLDRWIRIFSRFNEVLSGMVVVKSFVREEAEKRRLLRGVRAANRLVVRGVRVDSTVNGARKIVVALARVSALAFGGYLVAKGRLPLGSLVAFLGYATGLFQPVQSLTGMYQTLRRGAVSFETVLSILAEDDTMRDAQHAKDAHPFLGDVEFDHVTFSYREGRKVLDGVTFKARAGDTVAIVGPSGAGKSTLMALLERFYDPTAGHIRIDGVDLHDMKQRTVRAQIGVVLQDGVLFSDTIRENIAFGRRGASDAEIEEAARAAHAHEFIVKLPQGYDTVVGERGSTLSGGERQRIAIARALLKDAPILILDEATSALDAESEAKVQDALRTLTKGRTTFVIAHRLATVVAADRILVLKNGRIHESGRHAELVAAGGYYASLVAKQTGGVLPEAA